jgi:nitrate/nitrite transporter NarK
MGAWCLGNAMGPWLPTYYHEVFDMSLTKSSSITAIITVTGVLACIIGGLLSMRLGRRKPLLLISRFFMGITALFSVLFNNPAVIFLSIALFGFFGNLQNGAIYTIPMELPGITPRMGAVIFSFMQAGGNFGNFLGPLVVGYAQTSRGPFCRVSLFALLCL